MNNKDLETIKITFPKHAEKPQTPYDWAELYNDHEYSEVWGLSDRERWDYYIGDEYGYEIVDEED